MSPPTQAELDQALAALTGTVTESKPGDDLQANLLRLRLVAQAKAAGIPWAVIGRTLGLDGQVAKAQMKKLRDRTNRDLLRSQGPVAEPRPAAVTKQPHHVRRRGR